MTKLIQMYKYIIKDIKFFGYHGLYDDEIKNGQDFFITVSYQVKNKNNINKNYFRKKENINKNNNNNFILSIK